MTGAAVGAAGGAGAAEFEHALEPPDIEHVGGERHGADLGDARGAIATDQARAAHRRAASASTASGLSSRAAA